MRSSLFSGVHPIAFPFFAQFESRSRGRRGRGWMTHGSASDKDNLSGCCLDGAFKVTTAAVNYLDTFPFAPCPTSSTSPRSEKTFPRPKHPTRGRPGSPQRRHPFDTLPSEGSISKPLTSMAAPSRRRPSLGPSGGEEHLMQVRGSESALGSAYCAMPRGRADVGARPQVGTFRKVAKAIPCILACTRGRTPARDQRGVHGCYRSCCQV